MLLAIIKRILIFLGLIHVYPENESIEVKNRYYVSKSFMTPSEYKFYLTLSPLLSKYNIVPQVNLASIINKISNDRYSSELYRNIDYGIFTKDYSKLLLLIELNDSSHNEKRRRDRDLKVKKICNDAGIKLMTFFTKYPNEESYVIQRILNAVEKETPLNK